MHSTLAIFSPSKLLESKSFFKELFCLSMLAISRPPSSAAYMGALTTLQTVGILDTLTNEVSSEAERLEFDVDLECISEMNCSLTVDLISTQS